MCVRVWARERGQQQAPGAWAGRALRTILACVWPKRRINAWKLCASGGGITRVKQPRKEPERGDAGGREEGKEEPPGVWLGGEQPMGGYMETVS